MPSLSGTHDEQRPRHAEACTRDSTQARHCPKEDGSLISASCICPRGVFNDPQVAIPRVPFSFKAAPRDFHAMDSVFAKKGKVDYTGRGQWSLPFPARQEKLSSKRLMTPT